MVGELELHKSIDFNPRTSMYTVSAYISRDVKHSDKRGEYWKPETVWRHEFTYVEADDWDAHERFFADVDKTCAEKLTEFQATSSNLASPTTMKLIDNQWVSTFH